MTPTSADHGEVLFKEKKNTLNIYVSQRSEARLNQTNLRSTVSFTDTAWTKQITRYSDMADESRSAHSASRESSAVPAAASYLQSSISGA